MKHWFNDSVRQKEITKPVRLMTYATSAPGPMAATFMVPIPDSRLRVKISTLFIPTASEDPPDIIAAGATLWLAEFEQDVTGMQGRDICTTNILGTQAAPASIASVAPQLGHSLETVTAADYIQGVLSSSNPGQLGTWVVQCRYQPDSVRFTHDEWMQLRGAMNPIPLKGGGTL